MAFFPQSQTFFIKFDDFRSDLMPTMNKLTEFLELRPFTQFVHNEVNSNKYTDVISSEDWLYIKDTFYFDIKQVESILSWECSDWLER